MIEISQVFHNVIGEIVLPENVTLRIENGVINILIPEGLAQYFNKSNIRSRLRTIVKNYRVRTDDPNKLVVNPDVRVNREGDLWVFAVKMRATESFNSKNEAINYLNNL